MHLIVHREPLLAAWQLAAEATTKKDIKPALKSVLLSATPESVTLVGTDLEIAVRIAAEGVEVIEAGTTLIPTEKFSAILRESRENRLEIRGGDSGTNGNTNLLISAGNAEFESPTESLDGYPDIPSFPRDGSYITLSAGLLRTMLTRTEFAVADDGQRYAMQGVAFVRDGSGNTASLTLLATDGKRLSLSGTIGDYSQPAVVPTKAVKLLSRLLSSLEESEVLLAFRPNEVLVRAGAADIYSRLVEGRYPDWTRVLPKQSAATATFAPEVMLRAVRQAAIMAEKEAEAIEFSFAADLGGGEATLKTESATQGRSRVRVPLDYEGIPVTIRLNPQLLQEFLKRAASEGAKEVSLRLTDGASAALFQCGADWRFLVMPLT